MAVSVVFCSGLAAEMGICALSHAPSFFLTPNPFQGLSAKSLSTDQVDPAVSSGSIAQSYHVEHLAPAPRKSSSEGQSSAPPGEESSSPNGNPMVRHLGAAVFYSLSAANIIPGGALIGVALYTIYALAYCDEGEAYYSAQFFGKSIIFLGQMTKGVVGSLASLSGRVALEIKNIFNQFLAENEIPGSLPWVGVVAQVIIAIAVSHFAGAL